MAEIREANLRGDVPQRTLELIDMLATLDGKAGRMAWVLSVVEPEIERRLHAATVLCRIANINPLAVDRGGKA